MSRALLIGCLLSLFAFGTVEALTPEEDLQGDPESFKDQPATELLQNGSFELDADFNGIPDFWKTKAIPSPGGWDCTVAHSGSCSIMIPGIVSAKKAMQKVVMDPALGRNFLMAFWYKVVNPTPGAQVMAKMNFTFTDGTTGWCRLRIHDNLPADWKLAGAGCGVPLDVQSAKLKLSYSKSNGGAAWFDDVSMDVALTASKMDNRTEGLISLTFETGPDHEE